MRIGLAISDPLGITAQGLPTIEHAADPVQAVRAVMTEHEVRLVVLGHPINMDGSRGRQARVVEAFAEALRAAGVTVELRAWFKPDVEPRRKAADVGRSAYARRTP